MNSRNPLALRATAGFALTAAVAMFLPGCNSPRPVHALTGFDASGSWRKYLGVSAFLGARLAIRMEPGTDRLTFFRVDSETREFLDQAATGSSAALQETLVQELKNHPGHDGTYPAHFFSECGARASQNQDLTVVAYFSDGDNDDERPEARQEMRRAAESLAANRRVIAVAIYGASSENWAYLRDCFAPLKDRLMLYPPTQMDINELAERIDKARE